MISVLAELRRLDEARERGTVDEHKVDDLRRRMLDLVEDAEVTDSDAPAPDAGTYHRDRNLRHGAAIVFGAVFVATLLFGWLIGDMVLAFTASLVLVAGWVIRMSQRLDAEASGEAVEAGAPAESAADEPDARDVAESEEAHVELLDTSTPRIAAE